MTAPGADAPGELVIDVLGNPVPQGSMVAGYRGDKLVVVPSNQTQLAKWRGAIAKAARARLELTGFAQLDGPVDVDLTFWLERPAAAATRPFPHVAPDVDKLARACLDGLKDAGVWVDDSRAVNLRARKRYAVRTTGVRMRVRQSDFGLIVTRDHVDRLADLAGEALAENGMALAAGPGSNVAAIRLIVSTLLDELEGVVRA